MPSFNEMTIEMFPDWDVTPEESLPDEADDLLTFPDDAPGADEEPDLPGAGDSYEGTDPTAFTEQDGTVDEQEAAAPDANFGQADDPEAQEGVGDEAEGDDEDDTSDPSLIDSGRIIDATDDVRYPEQGDQLDELTYTSPESIQPSDEASIFVRDPELAQIAQELLDWQANELEQMRLELFNWFIEQRDNDITSEDATFEDQAEIDLEFLLNVDGRIRSLLGNYVFDSLHPELDGEDDDDLGDLFTSPSLLIDFGDIIGGVDQDTYMVEFNSVSHEDD